MTILADKTDIKLVIACQKTYLALDKDIYSNCICTLEDDSEIVGSKSSLRGVVQTYFSKKKSIFIFDI